MRQSCLLLLAILLLTYGYQGYKTVYKYTNDDVKVKYRGQLSDVAEKVLSVPLETPDSGVVRHVKRVQKDENNIFMLSDRRLLHFDVSGKFINQMMTETSGREDVFIADYTLDADRHQVIAIDSRRNVCKYDYSGNLISRTKLTQPWHKITAFACHDGYLWATAEKLVKIAGHNDSYQIVHSLYQLDSDMNEISSLKLHIADVGRDVMFRSLCVDELLVDEYGVYAYSSPADMKHLLSDTLHIVQRQNLPTTSGNEHDGKACIYPVRKGKRQFLSTCRHTIDNCYTFCYDNAGHTAYLLSKGFKDDFYDTGYITDFQSMDIYNESYCYLKSGADLSGYFPERAVSDDHPILFMVTLKS
ncbi:MAG: 6-bladed beta-propeller [Tannerella sp.]|jgi:hypothetical protein|nr:6-bladed beta-propeller [Tannerella sp.]